MRTEFETIRADEGSSFRLLHQVLQAEDYSWSYHYHPEYELVYVVDGHGRRHVGNHLSYYEDGDLVFMGKNLPHSGFGYGAVGSHEEVVIQFTENFLGEQLLQTPEFEAVHSLFQRSMQGIHFSQSVRRTIGKKLRCLQQLSPFARLIELLQILQTLALSLEYELLNAADESYDFNQKDEARLKKVYDYVTEHYRKPVNVHEVAQLVSLTVPSFCNYFKKNMRLTFTDFVNEYRINQASKRLLEGSSIADACYDSGFNNISYFTRRFRDIKGKSPGQYRRLAHRA